MARQSPSIPRSVIGTFLVSHITGSAEMWRSGRHVGPSWRLTQVEPPIKKAKDVFREKMVAKGESQRNQRVTKADFGKKRGNASHDVENRKTCQVQITGESCRSSSSFTRTAKPMRRSLSQKAPLIPTNHSMNRIIRARRSSLIAAEK